MKKIARWAFDIPVEGVCDRYTHPEELLQAFRVCRDTDPATAHEIIRYAFESGSVSAQFEYAKFLRTTPNLDMPQQERYRKAETLLLELYNLLDVPNYAFTANVALELGELYAECLHRPVGALSLYMYAQHLGVVVDNSKLDALQRKLKKMDINHLGNNYADALRLGQALRISDRAPKLTELFLREAVDKGAEELSAGRRDAMNCCGQACLTLGDFYDSRLEVCMDHEYAVYRTERDSMYAEAQAYGYPEYLHRDRFA